ncbi:sensor histidine kinase [uncultured Arthrobacter sp.]|uniref:sensor histidine kinase n=1 Tax=uncultured Arthrobacter sp. TaxID=114050 RepID=UPI0026291AD6|nr:histidine kinase [uncultured Arthrobacter sp.]
MTVQPTADLPVEPDAVRSTTATRSGHLPPPALRPWSRIWRYLVAVGVGLLLWLLVSADYLTAAPDGVPPSTEAAIGGLLVLDLLLGVLALCLLPLRRRLPVLTAALTVSFSAVSASSLGAGAVAGVSMSTRRRWLGVVLVGLIWCGATIVYEVLLRPSVPGVAVQPGTRWAAGGTAIAVYGICVAIGFYIGARRELLASLQERAENAEREQAMKAESAREAERTRIAREMHDVLAHRISLVALHAGALTYRTDLTSRETTEAAGVIQDNAHLALVELRQVLGVLRDEHHPDAEAEPPQPSLTDVAALLAAAEDAGTAVTLETAALSGAEASRPHAGLPQLGEAELTGLSETISRTAYRILQEALTNARKHAPGESVRIRLNRVDSRLQIEVRNGIPSTPAVIPGAGLGLTGLRERAELAGGALDHTPAPDGAFVLRAWLPST